MADDPINSKTCMTSKWRNWHTKCRRRRHRDVGGKSRRHKPNFRKEIMGL